MKSKRIPRRNPPKFYYSHQSTSSSTKIKTMPKPLKFPSSNMSDSNDNVSLQQTHEPNPILEPLFHALDPISLILNQNTHSHHQPFPLRLTTTESFIMERGPRYKAYAELREKRLRMKEQQEQEEHEEVKEPKFAATPPKKQVKFQGGLVSGRKGSSILAQSVPDFTAVLRKENRKPVNTLNSMIEMTPPPMKSFSNKGNNGVLSGSRGSKSASAGEKKKGGSPGGVVLMARKSYASIDELKNLSSVTANAINGEGKGGRNNIRVMGKTVSGYHRQF